MNRRFLVPVIGKISSGKSSFINALLGERILQDGARTITQFMCIIRHNPNSDIPTLYKILTNNTALPNSLQLSSIHNSENQSKFPSFEKGDRVAEGIKAIQLKIGEINQIIETKIKNNKQINENDMFYILEVKINLFVKFKISELFTNAFDFVDVPSLNESYNLDRKDNFNFIEEINKKTDQIGFYIFIIDHYSLDNDFADIIKNLKNKDTNNLIVITKIDQQNAYSTKKKLAQKLKIDLLKDNVSFIDSFLIKYLSSYLKTNSISDFANILYYSFKYFRSPKIAEIDKNLNFVTFCTNEYQSIKNEGYEIKNNNIVSNSSMDEFFEDKENEIKKNQTKIKETINLLMKDYGNHYIKKTIEILKNLMGNLKDCFRKNFERNLKYDSYQKQCLSILDETNEMAKNIKNKEKDFITKNIEEHQQVMNDFYYNQRIRITLLGGYNVQKSSLLNAIIGKNILPVFSKECTGKGIIIRYSEQKDSALYRMKIENEYICDSSEPPIAKGNCEVIKKAIEKLNKDINNKQDFFYLLTTKIEFLDRYGIEPEIRDIVEFVDFPVPYTKINPLEDDNFYTLIKSSKLFLFINNKDLINERGDLLILNSLFERISFIKSIDTSTFSSSSIFVLNKVDEQNLVNIGKDKKSLGSVPMKGKNEKKKVEQLMKHAKVVTFSSFDYLELIKDFTIWTKLENTIYHLYENYKINVLGLDKEQSFIDFCLEAIEDKYENLKIETNINIMQTEVAQSQQITFKEIVRTFDAPNPESSNETNDDINKFLELFNLLKKHYSNKKLLINSINDLFNVLKEKISDVYIKYKDMKEKLIQERLEKISDLIKQIVYKIDKRKKDNEIIESLRKLLREKHFDEKAQKSINQLESIYNEISQDYYKSNDELKKKYDCILLKNVPEEMWIKYSNKINEILKYYNNIENIKKEIENQENWLEVHTHPYVFSNRILAPLFLNEDHSPLSKELQILLGNNAVVDLPSIIVGNFIIGIVDKMLCFSIKSTFIDSEIRKNLKNVVDDLQIKCRIAIENLQNVEEHLKQEEEDYSKYREKENQIMLKIQRKVEQLKEIMIQF